MSGVWLDVKLAWYVYAHSIDGKVFYIGKGSGQRAFSARGRSDAWEKTVRRHGGFTVEIVAWHETEAAAFAQEARMIMQAQPRCNGTRKFYAAIGEAPPERSAGVMPREAIRALQMMHNPELSAFAARHGLSLPVVIRARQSRHSCHPKTIAGIVAALEKERAAQAAVTTTP